MIDLLILAPGRNYQRISVDMGLIRRGFSDSRRVLEPEKLLSSLATADMVDATECMPYGASIPFNRDGRKNILPEDIADFFEEVRDYGKEHKVDYALIQDFKFQTGRTKNELSAVVQLLLRA